MVRRKTGGERAERREKGRGGERPGRGGKVGAQVHSMREVAAPWWQGMGGRWRVTEENTKPLFLPGTHKANIPSNTDSSAFLRGQDR